MSKTNKYEIRRWIILDEHIEVGAETEEEALKIAGEEDFEWEMRRNGSSDLYDSGCEVEGVELADG